jgi:quercetin dioxygenase-like cupin family protein
MNTTLVGLCVIVLSAAQATTQDVPVPVEEEPYHRTVFMNAYVQAFRVTLKPGQVTGMHVHAHDDAPIVLSTATTAADSPGRPIGPPGTSHPGDVSTRDNEASPITHRVHNVGTTVFDVIDVQVLSRPPGLAAPAVSPPAAENAKLRVYRYEVAPGAATAQHIHARPYLIVAVTGADLRMTSSDGASMDDTIKTGDMHWIDSAVTHALGNRGSETMILVEVEVK